MNRTILSVIRMRNNATFYRSMAFNKNNNRLGQFTPQLDFNKPSRKDRIQLIKDKRDSKNEISDLEGVQTAEKYLSDKFSNDKIFSFKEWDAIRDDLIDNSVTDVLLESQILKLVTKVSCDATIFGVARKYGAISSAISYYKYLTHSLTDIHIHHLDNLLKVINESKIKEEHEEFVISICELVFKKGYGQVIAKVYQEALQALSSTANWKSALVEVEGISNVNLADRESFSNIYAALALRAYSEGDYELMWKLLEDPKFHTDLIEIRQVNHLSTVLNQNKVFLNWISHCETLRATVGEEQANINIQKLFKYFQKVSFFLDEPVASKLEEFYAASRVSQSSVTKIQRNTGKCFNCSHLVPTNQMKQEEFDILKDAVVENIITGGDLFQNTNPKELKTFMKMLEKNDKIDVVVDGQNIALLQVPGSGGNKNYKDQSKLLLDTITHLDNMGKRIMVIHRTNMKGYPDYRLISDRAKCILLDKVTQDDPYMLIAALHSGNDCLLVTNDLLRQYYYKLSEKSTKLAKLFVNWQFIHQMQIPFVNILKKSGKNHYEPNFTIPVRHKIEASETLNRWHIPIREERTPNSVNFQTPKNWMCIGERSQEKKSTNKVVKSKDGLKSTNIVNKIMGGRRTEEGRKTVRPDLKDMQGFPQL